MATSAEGRAKAVAEGAVEVGLGVLRGRQVLTGECGTIRVDWSVRLNPSLQASAAESELTGECG